MEIDEDKAKGCEEALLRPTRAGLILCGAGSLRQLQEAKVSPCIERYALYQDELTDYVPSP